MKKLVTLGVACEEVPHSSDRYSAKRQLLPDRDGFFTAGTKAELVSEHGDVAVIRIGADEYAIAKKRLIEFATTSVAVAVPPTDAEREEATRKQNNNEEKMNNKQPQVNYDELAKFVNANFEEFAAWVQEKHPDSYDKLFVVETVTEEVAVGVEVKPEETATETEEVVAEAKPEETVTETEEVVAEAKPEETVTETEEVATPTTPTTPTAPVVREVRTPVKFTAKTVKQIEAEAIAFIAERHPDALAKIKKEATTPAATAASGTGFGTAKKGSFNDRKNAVYDWFIRHEIATSIEEAKELCREHGNLKKTATFKAVVQEFGIENIDF